MIPTVTTAMMVPVSLFLLFTAIALASPDEMCGPSEHSGPCRDVDREINLMLDGGLLSIWIGLFTWVWPRTRRGGVLRRWNLGIYAALVTGLIVLSLITSESPH